MAQKLTENHHAEIFRLPLYDSRDQLESVLFPNAGYNDGKRTEAFLFSRMFYRSSIAVKSAYAYPFIDNFLAQWLGEKQ